MTKKKRDYFEAITMKKLLFIMNPFAGQKKANKVLPEILMVFTEAGYEIQPRYLQIPFTWSSVIFCFPSSESRNFTSSRLS